jgi:hypothetical protein
MARAGKVKAPVRQKKSDRLTHPKVSEAEQIIDYTIAPLQRAIQQADERWGIDMLPELVSPESAAKWGLCMARLNEAIDKHDVDGATQWVGASLRGLGHMEAEAASRGALRASADVLEVELNGKVYGIMKDGRSWQEISKQRPGLELKTLREVAVALEWWAKHGLGCMESEVKKHFPGAEIVESRPGDSLNDEINFG